ncbi:MAG: VCBS repeat-containing protein [Chthoniobacteraceae bacterium]
MRTTPLAGRARIEPLETRIAPAFVSGTFNLADLSGANGSTFNGASSGDASGAAVGAAGDVNGDGFGDFLIGAFNTGVTYVIFGRASGFPRDVDLGDLTGIDGFQITGGSGFDGARAAGDVNGDGFDDILVNTSSAAAVIFGKASGFAPQFSVFALDGSNGFVLIGATSSVSGAGDVNGDGFDDVILGDVNADGKGAAYVVFGKRDGFAATIGVTTLAAGAGVKLAGVGSGDQAGRAVRGAGDVNGDGFADVVVGAPFADQVGNDDRGAAYVVFGGSALPATIDLNGLGGATGFRAEGSMDNDNAGISVSAAGDMNGDGLADVLVGATRDGAGGPESGAGVAYVLFGSSGSFAPRFGLDIGLALAGVEAGDNTGSAVSAAGDVNGDGFDDLLVGTLNGGGANDPGTAYVVFGKAGNFLTPPNLATLDGTDGFTIVGEGNFDSIGRRVSGAGDVNGDGFADVLVAGINPNSGGGASYLVLGGPSGTFVAPTIAAGGKTATWTDVDGDLVTLKVTKGTLDAANFSLLANSATDSRARLLKLDVGTTPGGMSEFEGTDITLTAKRAGGGDGKVNLGFLRGSNTDLGAVKIGGDLARMFVGDATDEMALKSLTLDSVGLFGARLQDTGGEVRFLVAGPAGPVKIAGDFREGRLFGVQAATAGTGTIASITIGGSMIGGKRSGSGQIIAETLGPVKIGGDLVGGAGFSSGFLGADRLTSLTVGGSILGAGATNSGAVQILGPLGPVSIGGDLVGAAGFSSGSILALQSLGRVGIKGSQFGGAGVNSGSIVAGDLTVAVAIAGVSIGGDARAGSASTSGGIFAEGALGPVSIGGDVVGTAEQPYVIAGVGPLTGAKSLAIASVKIGGDFERGQILGGYAGDQGGGFNGRAQIGAITVGGDWIASSAAAGLLTHTGATNANGIFGNGDDAFIAAGPATGVASIKSVTIKGAARGTFEDGDRFAVVAETIGSVSIGGKKLPLTKSTTADPANDLAAIPVGATPDFVVREVSRTTAAPAPTFTATPAAGPRTAFPAAFDLGALASGDGFKVSGVAGGDRAGHAVSDAGDVNGDGFDDFIVGAYNSDEGGDDRGASYVVFGQAGGLSSFTLTALTGFNGFKLQGSTDNDYAGSSVSAAGDVNGDGFDDVIVGALEADRPGGLSAGAAYVVFGRSSFASGSIALAALDGTDGLKLLGGAQNDRAGFSVSGAGDVNGDGFDDVIVGAIGVERTGLDSRGAAYVIFGRQSFASAATPGFTIGLETLDGTDGFRLLGEVVGDTAGKSVSAAGDVNGDGFDDMLVGADSASTGDAAAYVVFGRPSFTATPAAGFSIGLGTLQGTAGVKFTSANPSTFATYAVGAAGDVNGDGFDDMIFGGESGDPGNVTNAGAAYVVFGKTSFTPAPVADFSIPLGGLNGADGFQIPGLVSQGFAGFSVDGAGDVNGDGFADLVVGVPYAPTLSGSAYVVFGRAGGFGATLSPATLDGANGFTIHGEAASNFAGFAVSAAGDVNGDGFADVLVGAPGSYSTGGLGAAYVIYGGPSGEFIDPTISTDGKTATWTDVDGDAVTLKVTKGTLAEGNFQLLANSTTDPSARLLSLIVGSVAGTLSEFDGANVSLTAKRAGGGDGKVNVGFLNASNTDLGAVTISGDLGKIVAGDGDADPAVKSLTLGSLGVFGGRTQDTGGNLRSDIFGPAGAVKVAGDVREALLLFLNSASPGTAASVTVGGSVIGGKRVFSGLIAAQDGLGPVKIGGDLVGGAGALSGYVEAPAIASLTVGGSMLGGAGTFSGGALGGAFAFPGSLATSGSLGAVTIGGDQRGGDGIFSGALFAGTGIGKVAIKRDQIGGAGSASALLFTANPGANIASVSIGGDARGGDAVFSGGILAGGTLGPVSIAGDVIGTAEQAYLIRGAGPLTGLASLAITSLKVGGDFERALVLAGFAAENVPVNGHAQIGAISVGGDWIASSVTAGLIPRAGALDATGFFGNGDDKFIAGGPTNVIAIIASITIKGQVRGTLETGDRFGIVAQQINSVTIGGVKVALTPGLDSAGFAIGQTPDFFVREVAR